MNCPGTQKTSNKMDEFKRTVSVVTNDNEEDDNSGDSSGKIHFLACRLL